MFPFPPVGSLLSSAVSPDANPETSSLDGDMENTGSSSTWAGKRDTTTADNRDAGAKDMGVGWNALFTTQHIWQTWTRSLALADFSALGTPFVIGAKLNLTPKSITERIASSRYLALTRTTTGADTTIAFGDWDGFTDTHLTPAVQLSTMVAETAFDMAFNAAGISEINTVLAADGVLRTMLRFAADVDDAPPTLAHRAAHNDIVELWTADKGGARVPVFTVYYRL